MADRNFISGYDPRLTNQVLKNPDLDRYVWNKVAPILPVGGSSGVVISDLSVARDTDINLRPGAETKIVSHTGGTVNIQTVEKGAKEFAKKGDAYMVGGFSNLVDAKAAYVTMVYNIAMEKRLATILANATNKAALSGTDQWSDDTADPYSKIIDIMDEVTSQGYKANALIMGVDVFNKLKRHPNLMKYAKYTSGARVLRASDLRDIFEVDYVFVSRAIYDTAQKGATASKDYIIKKVFAVMEIPKAPQWGTASALYTPEFTPYQVAIIPHEERPNSGSWVIGYADNDIKEYVPDAMYVLTDVLA